MTAARFKEQEKVEKLLEWARNGGDISFDS